MQAKYIARSASLPSNSDQMQAKTVLIIVTKSYIQCRNNIADCSITSHIDACSE